MSTISKMLVLGGGSAGLLAAIALKRGFPPCDVKVVRSKEIGVIGVGEGTTPTFPWFLHTVLGLSKQVFFERVKPTWKLGIRFLWGARGEFNYAFSTQIDQQWPDLPRPNGFYCHEDFTDVNLQSALMRRDKVFPINSEGRLQADVFLPAYHIENVKLVAYFEWQAAELGIEVIDDVMSAAGHSGGNITHIDLKSGKRLAADLYVDASGFRAELIGKILGEPFVDFSDTLLCDRAVVASRPYDADEAIEPYTTAETYDHGWCWRIDHEHHSNRGYVYCSGFVSDQDAEAEYQRKNPKMGPSFLVRFRSGRHRRSWVGNVVAVGNAGGFVEPLEATALMLLSIQCRALVQMLMDSFLDPTPEMRQLHNDFINGHWDDTRNFLSIHYRYNTLLDTPFWRHCRATVPVHDLQPLLEFYAEHGPSLMPKGIALRENNLFGLDGHYALLVGMNVPYKRVYNASPAERQRWRAHQNEFVRAAEGAASIRTAIEIMRSPQWVWTPRRK
jgi:tryptophan 7-halogenase